MYPNGQKIEYSVRLAKLNERIANIGSDKIRVLETNIVKTKEEAQAFFEKCLDAGEEGAMIKNMNAVWVPKRTKDLGKMKAEEVADLLVIDTFDGNGKYTDMIGGFICETADGKLRVRVGSGLSDEERILSKSEFVGKIIEVMYNQVITSKDKDTASLFLPRFMGVRVDKTVANTFEELK